MKIKHIAVAASLAWSSLLCAATLPAPTAVQIQPDPLSAVIVVLKAGSEQPAPSDKAGPAPAGWSAVVVPGPFEAFVKNKDLAKSLDIIPGSPVFQSPKEGAAVLTIFDKADKADITGLLKGGWTRVRLDKALIGYIQMAPAATAPAASAPAAAPAAFPSAVQPSGTAPVAVVTGSDSTPASLSRLFEGTLSSTRNPLLPRRPFAWQLSDPDGNRIAFVDLGRLLLTDQIESYAGHAVVVLGTLKTIPDSKDLVIDAEGLRLK